MKKQLKICTVAGLPLATGGLVIALSTPCASSTTLTQGRPPCGSAPNRSAGLIPLLTLSPDSQMKKQKVNDRSALAILPGMDAVAKAERASGQSGGPAHASPGNILAAKTSPSATLRPGMMDLSSTRAGFPSHYDAPATGNPGVLDQRHQFALGMLETGNDDREIGGAGEVSRYQIMPSVWRQYSPSRNYRNPEVSLAVARRHWATLYLAFKQQAGREPTDFDMYVLWNTHFGYYSGRNFDPARLAPAVRDRAQRYVNLVQCGDGA